jgi:hypothetical protein
LDTYQSTSTSISWDRASNSVSGFVEDRVLEIGGGVLPKVSDVTHMVGVSKRPMMAIWRFP